MVSGPGPTSRKGFGDRDKGQFVDVMTEAGWEVRPADHQQQAPLPDDARAIVYFGPEPEFNLPVIGSGLPVVFVRELGWSTPEPKFRHMLIHEGLPGKLRETVKFVDNAEAAAKQVVKLEARRRSVAEGSPQAAQNNSRDLRPVRDLQVNGLLAGPPDRTTAPPGRERNPPRVERKPLEHGK